MLNIMRKMMVTGVDEKGFDIRVGDQIGIPLEGFGDFTATAQKVESDSVLFIFDEIVTRQPMNNTNTNEGGFDASQLYKWLQETLLPAFPEWIRSRVKDLTIPTVGQITGWSDEWDRENLEPDNDEQLPLMKDRKNRIALFNGDLTWYWLRNTTKEDCSSAFFAFVSSCGDAGYNGASNSCGVRPVFRLVKEESRGPVPRSRVSYTSYYNKRNKDVVSKDSLLNEIGEKERDIYELRQQIMELEKKRSYDEGARETKLLVESYVDAGFSEEQAIEIVTRILAVVLGSQM